MTYVCMFVTACPARVRGRQEGIQLFLDGGGSRKADLRGAAIAWRLVERAQGCQQAWEGGRYTYIYEVYMNVRKDASKRGKEEGTYM